MDDIKRQNKKDGSSIAAKLRTLRAEFNTSQAEVAKMLGISQQTYSKYESQDYKIDSETIIKLCNFYGISSDYLLGIENKPKAGNENVLTSLDQSDEAIDMIVAKVLSKINKN